MSGTIHILITGGAGFVGSNVARELLAHGYRVRALDSLDERVHGPDAGRPDSLPAGVELIVGDVTEPAAVRYAAEGIDAVVHLAARVGGDGVLEGMAPFARANDVGTAVLLDELADLPLDRLVVASSVRVYGEGKYVGADGNPRRVRRSREELARGSWDPLDERGRPLTPVPTPESTPPEVSSPYPLTKFSQETMCLLFGRAYGIPTVVLRLSAAYGPGQALADPYAGMLTVFGLQLLDGRPPLVPEDGLQTRDFVHVTDVARAVRLALERPVSEEAVVNVAGGVPRTARELAEGMARALGAAIEPRITGGFRSGDVRHCFPDTTRAERILGFRADVDLDEGLAGLASWLRERRAVPRTIPPPVPFP